MRNLYCQIEAMGNVDGYQQDGALKARFHQLGRKILRKLATDLNLPKGSFDIRSNMAGPAVSGEITLHSDHIYVQISCDSLTIIPDVLYRSCQGRTDYCGGSNNFCRVSDLPSERVLGHMRMLSDSHAAEPAVAGLSLI